MIDNETVRKLRQLDLSEFVDTLEMQEMDQDTRHLPFDERLQRSIDYLYLDILPFIFLPLISYISQCRFRLK